VGAVAVGCNALLGIDEATLCSEAACDTEAAATSEPQATLPAKDSVDRVEADDSASSASASGDAGSPRGAGASASVELVQACNTPTQDVARDCASCGGVVACDGRCSVGLPLGLGEPCGSCGGTIDCRGECSVMTPSDYGSMLPLDIPASFACCFIDEVRSYGPDGPDTSGCYPGYNYDGCTVSKVSGRGSVSVVNEDAATCTCGVHVQNTGLDGATYTVHIRLKRGCQPE
jgi:hypothetical protein